MKITAVLQYMYITEVVGWLLTKSLVQLGKNCWEFHWKSGVLVIHVSNIFSKIVRYIWYKTPHFYTNFFRNSNGISDKIFPSCTKLNISREGTFGCCLIIDWLLDALIVNVFANQNYICLYSFQDRCEKRDICSFMLLLVIQNVKLV